MWKVAKQCHKAQVRTVTRSQIHPSFLLQENISLLQLRAQFLTCAATTLIIGHLQLPALAQEGPEITSPASCRKICLMVPSCIFLPSTSCFSLAGRRNVHLMHVQDYPTFQPFPAPCCFCTTRFRNDTEYSAMKNKMATCLLYPVCFNCIIVETFWWGW